MVEHTEPPAKEDNPVAEPVEPPALDVTPEAEPVDQPPVDVCSNEKSSAPFEIANKP